MKQMKFAMKLITHNKAGLAFPPHVAADVGEARALHKLVAVAGPLRRFMGQVQGEHALSKLVHGYDDGAAIHTARARSRSRTCPEKSRRAKRRMQREHR